MMREAPNKLKFKNLRRRLRLSYWECVGVLESLWLSTYANAPDGDIGRLTNDEIAASIEWDRDANELINALVETRWLDRSERYRLLIHEWPEHCSSTHKGNYIKWGKSFAASRSDNPSDVPSEPRSDNPSEHPSKPNQTNPNPPHQTKPGGGGGICEWTPEARKSVIDALRANGLGRCVQVATEAQTQGLSPSDVLGIVREYEAHRDLFRSAGAIADRIRTGVWPAEGVTPPIVVEKVRSAKQEREAKTAAERTVTAIVKAGQAEKLSDEAIRERIRQAVPEKYWSLW